MSSSRRKSRVPQTGTVYLSNPHAALETTNLNRLMNPEAQELPPPKHVHRVTKVPLTATWHPKAVPPQKFISVHQESFMKARQNQINSQEDHYMAQVSALEKLAELSTLHYGGNAGMFQMWDKQAADYITSDEMAKYIKQKNLDEKFSIIDQNHIISMFDHNNERKVIAGELWKKLDEVVHLHHEGVAHITRKMVRGFLADKHEETTRVNKLMNFEGNDLTGRQTRRGNDIQGEGGGGGGGGGGSGRALNENATCMDELGSTDSKSDVLVIRTTSNDTDFCENEELFTGRIGEGIRMNRERGAEYEKVLHTLSATDDPANETKSAAEVAEERIEHLHALNKLANLKMLNVPFYSLRADNVKALELRAEQLDISNTFALQARIRDLEERRFKEWDQIESNTLRVAPQESDMPRSLNKPQGLSASTSSLPRTGGFHSTDSADATTSPPRPSTSGTKLDPISPVVKAKTKQKASKPRDLSGVGETNRSGDISECGSVNSIPLDGPDQDLVAADKSHWDACNTARDFQYSVARNVVASKAFEPAPNRLGLGGKRLYEQPDTLISTYGLKGNYPDVGITSEEQFQTMSSEYFTAFVNKPSEPVARMDMGDADRESVIREDRRRRKYERTVANLERTKLRLEHDQLMKEFKEQRRLAKKNDDVIRYSTSVFLHDLTCFNKMPLMTTMAKKANVDASLKMWTGQIGPLMHKDSPEFSTTYLSSFDSSKLRQGGVFLKRVGH